MPLLLFHYDRPDDRQALNALLDRLASQLGDDGDIARQTAAIIDDVRRRGDQALVHYMRQWTDPAFTVDRIRVRPEELQAAARSLDPAFRDAALRSIDHVRQYQRHLLPADPPTIVIDGAELGLRFTPIRRVGLHVPGGRAAYPSSVIMLAAPAQTAGVEQLSVVCPPPTVDPARPDAPADVSPLVLGVCHLLGLDRVYRLGGAQAIAALALGTESVEPVDFIAGPGNAYTQQAKRQLFGRVGIDGLFGPSEIVVVADESARPDWVAADLLAQAEHDPGCCFLLSTSPAVIDAIARQIDRQLPARRRRPAIEKAMRDWSAAVVVPSPDALAQLVDRIAAEHVTLAVADPAAMLARLRHGGAWFLGHATPVASGDYYAGPSHCLPTGATARFSSGLSVYTFLKRSSVERYPAGPGPQAVADIAVMAEAEGLDAHAHSVRLRAQP
jgi:histidinol dehydrogenase